MSRFVVLALLAAIGSSGPLDGCYGYEDHLTLMPDGSGKIELILSEKTTESSSDKAKAGLLEIANETSGFAAFTAPAIETKDGWVITRFTVYFEDINRFKYVSSMHDNDLHKECLHFSLKARPNDKNLHVLDIEDWLFGSQPPRDGPPVEEPAWEQTKKDLENVVKRRVTVPGKVTVLTRFQGKEGRTAVVERSLKSIRNRGESIDNPISGGRQIEFAGNEVSDAELAAFKKELAAAKDAWPKIREVLEAARRRQEAEKK